LEYRVFLALTFTEAAAAEMKHRLQAEMHRKLSETPDPFLEEQLIFLQTAKHIDNSLLLSDRYQKLWICRKSESETSE
jgi:ATP-dependent exoDNAse (exonuclease V) beta subunit